MSNELDSVWMEHENGKRVNIATDNISIYIDGMRVCKFSLGNFIGIVELNKLKEAKNV